MVQVDIVLGIFNGAEFIRQQIESIQRQTFQNWRLIVRDDGSKDHSISIISSLARDEPRIVVMDDQLGNVGFNENYHVLLRKSTADFVMFSDQDDEWMPDKIARTLQSMDDSRRTFGNVPTLVHCDSAVTNTALKVQSTSFVGRRAGCEGLSSILLANPVQGATMMINRSLRELMLKGPVALPYDYKAALYAEACGRRIFLPLPLMFYRQHGKNAIGTRVAETSTWVPPTVNVRRVSATFQLGLSAFEPIVRTLHAVRHAWHCNVDAELRRHGEFVQGAPSLHKLRILRQQRYTFYKRADLFVAGAYSLGFLKSRV